MDNKGWYAVDLDGTLAHYESGDAKKWDGLSIGKPIPKMVERVKKMIRQGKTVKIFTARISKMGNATGVDATKIRKIIVLIQDWCEEHLGERLEVVNEKDYYMIELYDDRARQVIQNQGICIDELLAEWRKLQLRKDKV